MLVIDGSEGEGGGQVLRTSLGLSMVTGQPFRIERIRARRERPGLLRQHLTGVRAAAAISGASVEGDALGSASLTFRPGAVKPGAYRFAVGTAGSTGLVLQAILPAMLAAQGASFEVEIEGGTHASSAPPFDFLQRCFAPALRRMGADLDLALLAWGFYPAGGGALRARVLGTPLRSVELHEPGALVGRRARAVVAHLPHDVAERELALLRHRLGLEPGEARPEHVDSAGPGNVVIVEIEAEHATEVVTSFGARGRSAESVAQEAVDEVRRWRAAQVPVGEHLCDQLLVPMALAGGGSFRTVTPSLHSTTNADVVRRFLDVDIRFTQESDAAWRCDVRSR